MKTGICPHHGKEFIKGGICMAEIYDKEFPFRKHCFYHVASQQRKKKPKPPKKKKAVTPEIREEILNLKINESIIRNGATLPQYSRFISYWLKKTGKKYKLRTFSTGVKIERIK